LAIQGSDDSRIAAGADERRVACAGREQALDALDDLPRCFSQIVPATETARSAFDIALALGHPFPDCVYLACAVMASATLVTDDRKFLEKAVAGGHRRHVIHLVD
jgi:predicted nucleic acid-binding protein